MESGKVVCGKYRLNSLLGSGGMAEVWSATNTFTERELAIKFMTPQVQKTPEAAARFLKEAKVSARINHPSVIDIQDVGQTEDGQLFLVMELLSGVPLEVALKRQTPPMTLAHFTRIMIEVGSALEAAHRSGIVHRDLKPTNIFLHTVRDGVAIPKLLDFGVSKFLEDDQNYALTTAGTVLGSPLYMSPEQARGDAQIDGRTDIFAFGAILFEALCGYRAYEARNFNALIVKIATTKPRSIDDCAPGVPECLRRITRACMEVDPAARIASFAPIVEMLRDAARELAESPARLPPPLTAAADSDAAQASAPGAHRTGERTPETAPISPLSGGPTAPSWHTPNTSYASVTVGPQKKSNGARIAIALGAVTLAAVAAGGGVAWRLRSTRPATALAAQTKPAPPVAAPATLTSAPLGPSAVTNLPTAPTSVSVDSLPGATTPLGPLAKGAGRLFVNASPGSCMLLVDGKERGPTPVTGLDLPVGAHQLECRLASGKSRTASITVQDGATSRFKFALDE